MSRLINFSEEQIFAWGDTIHVADEPCEVERCCITGESRELLRFEEDCPHHLRLKVCTALNADTTFLDSDEEEDDDDPQESAETEVDGGAE